MAELRTVVSEESQVASKPQRRRHKRRTPVKRQPVDDLKEIIAPDYRKILTFLIAAVVIVGALVALNLFASNYVETHSRATFAEASIKAANEHKQYEAVQADHNARLIKLEANNIQTNENFIKVNIKLDSVLQDLKDLKEVRRK